jgi:hypothetical protein
MVDGLFFGFPLDTPSDCLLFDIASAISISCTFGLGLRALSWSTEALLEACEGALCSWNRLWLSIALSYFRLSMIILSTFICLLVRYLLTFCIEFGVSK